MSLLTPAGHCHRWGASLNALAVAFSRCAIDHHERYESVHGPACCEFEAMKLPSSRFRTSRYGPALAAYKRLVLAAIAIVLSVVADAQDSQFAFDLHGNFLSQTAETLGAPQILAQPQQQVVQPGELASFFVVGVDEHGLSYQWLFNGTNLPG